jgi:hypothetical protein
LTLKDQIRVLDHLAVGFEYPRITVGVAVVLLGNTWEIVAFLDDVRLNSGGERWPAGGRCQEPDARHAAAIVLVFAA